jgi:ATP/maltotriose-dependent transcriptional regulator MalT
LFNIGRLSAALQRVEEAVTHAESFRRPDLLSQALAMRATVRFLRGDGVDEPGLRRALEFDDHKADMPFALRPTVHNAIIRSCTGELDSAHSEFTVLRQRCIEHGQDGELMLVAFHGGLVEIWRGHFAAAALIAEDTMQLAQQLGGDLPLSVALTFRAVSGAYLGRVDGARADVDEARAAIARCGSKRLGEWPATALGFLEVSLGNYDAALDAVAPLVAKVQMESDCTEIIAASFIPDAIEAMVALGRLEPAEQLVSALLRNGERLQRDWMLAVGGRGRGMLLAARGDTSAAVEAVEQAIFAHDRLAMPFERARTQLVLGQLQRRKRLKDASAVVFSDALQTFEQLETPLWADRARAELGRVNVDARRTVGLSSSERQVAELAASGMTNRNIAAAMYISPKTVESNLSRIYAKLGIRSRAELGQRIGQLKG